MGKMGGVTNRQNGKCDIWGKWVRAHRSRAQFVLGGHVRLDGSRGGRVLRVCRGCCGGGVRGGAGVSGRRGKVVVGGVGRGEWVLVESAGESDGVGWGGAESSGCGAGSLVGLG